MTSATSPLTKLGPYELVRRLGAGGMAETFLAVRRGPAGFQQDVCLKRVLPALNEDRQFVELFLEEARIQSRVRHGNIVQVYDFGEANGSYYLALELVDGVDLNAVLNHLNERRQRLPVAVALLVLRELCRALEVAHNLTIDGVRQHLVHRDISPSNILVSVTGEVKLTDFGIAVSQNREYRTQTGHARGKLGYMPPEQVQGLSVDARSDLFSLGVVLYLMLTGEHPFRGTGISDYEVLNRVVRGDYKPPRKLVRTIPAELEALTKTMMAVDPEARPRSAREVLERTASLLPPVHADRELAELVSAVKEARERAEEQVRASRPSRRITVRAPGTDDPTGVRPPRVETQPLPEGGHAAEWSPATEMLTDSSLEVESGERAAVVIADRGAQQATPSRRALVTLALSFALLLATGAAWLIRAKTIVEGGADLAHEAGTVAPSSGGAVSAARSPGPTGPAVKAPEEPLPSAAPITTPVAISAPTHELPAARPAEASAGSVVPPQAEQHGTLRVLVAPYGQVRIDGELIGDAPVRKRVSAGTHVIEAGHPDSPTRRTKAVVVAGQTKVVRIRLEE